MHTKREAQEIRVCPSACKQSGGVDQDVFILYSVGEVQLPRCCMSTIGRNWTQIARLQRPIGATGAIHRMLPRREHPTHHSKRFLLRTEFCGLRNIGPLLVCNSIKSYYICPVCVRGVSKVKVKNGDVDL